MSDFNYAEDISAMADAAQCDAERAITILARLAQDRNGTRLLITYDQHHRLSRLLTRTANALKGEPPELVLHDWSDLPEVAQRLTEERDLLRSVVEILREYRHVQSTRTANINGQPDWEAEAHLCIEARRLYDEVTESLAKLDAWRGDTHRDES